MQDHTDIGPDMKKAKVLTDSLCYVPNRAVASLSKKTNTIGVIVAH